MDTKYPNLRAFMGPEYESLTDTEIETAFESAFGEGVTPAEYESFFGSIGNAFASAGRFVQKEAPGLTNIAQGAAQGAVAGSALGPWGALGGALVGGTGAGLRHYGSGTTRDVGGALGTVVGTAGQLTGRGAMMQTAGSAVGMAGGALQGRYPAASQLASLLGRPEVLAALGSLAGGRNPAVQVGGGGTPVPASAIAGLLGALGREAEAEAEAYSSEWTESVPGYLFDGSGQLIVDPRVPEQRAGRVLQLMNASPRAQMWIVDSSEGEWNEAETEAEAYGDYIDASEWWAA